MNEFFVKIEWNFIIRFALGGLGFRICGVLREFFDLWKFRQNYFLTTISLSFWIKGSFLTEKHSLTNGTFFRQVLLKKKTVR